MALTLERDRWLLISTAMVRDARRWSCITLDASRSRCLSTSVDYLWMWTGMRRFWGVSAFVLVGHGRSLEMDSCGYGGAWMPVEFRTY